jgi:hypothetical protein
LGLILECWFRNRARFAPPPTVGSGVWRYLEGSVAVPDLGWENLTTLTLVPSKQRIKPTKLPLTTGKLEVTIKINELPLDVQTNKDNWKIFQLDCDGRVVFVTGKPKI